MPFIPESPRWLYHQGDHEACKLVLAQVTSRGDVEHPDVMVAFREIADVFAADAAQSRTTSPKNLVKDGPTIRRLLIGLSVACLSTSVGNLIAGYYFGAELATAGITDPVAQLKAVSAQSTGAAWAHQGFRTLSSMFGASLPHWWAPS